MTRQPPDPRPQPAWDDRPPVPGQRWVAIAIPRPGAPIRCTVLSEALIGVWLHWLGPEYRPPRGGSCPCVLPRESCDLCKMPRMVPRWTGYLSAWDWGLRAYVLLELTEHAIYTLPSLFPEDGASIRGRSLSLVRDGPRHNSPVMAQWLPDPPGIDRAPPAADVRECLLRLWGYPSGVGLAWDDLRALEVARAARERREEGGQA